MKSNKVVSFELVEDNTRIRLMDYETGETLDLFSVPDGMKDAECIIEFLAIPAAAGAMNVTSFKYRRTVLPLFYGRTVLSDPGGDGVA